MVEYRMRNVMRASVLCGAALSLIACQSIREAAGITKEPPDEFAVVTKAPLIIPPDFNLHPPKPGAPPTNQASPTQAAQAALYSDDPNAVAATITGNFSPAEKLFLATSGAAGADHSIRREIAADNASSENTDQSFTDSLLFGKPTDTADKPLDADAEKSRMDAGKPAATDTPEKSSESATVGKEDSGSSWWPF